MKKISSVLYPVKIHIVEQGRFLKRVTSKTNELGALSLNKTASSSFYINVKSCKLQVKPWTAI